MFLSKCNHPYLLLSLIFFSTAVPLQTIPHHMSAQQLLNPYRIDLMAKYIYAKFREFDLKSDFAKELYAAHLRAWGQGHYFEEIPLKQKLQDFTNMFDKILDAIKSDNFNWNHDIFDWFKNSSVPVWQADPSFICDGAHRVAACLIYHKNVQVCLHEQSVDISNRINLTRYKIYQLGNKIYDLFYFKDRNLAEQYLDAMALQYCYLQKNSYIALIFPAASSDKDLEVEQILRQYGDIVAKKKICFFKNGPANLLCEAYCEEGWFNDHNPGLQARVRASFGSDLNSQKPTTVYLIESDSVAKVQMAKDRIRILFGFRESIHTTDTHAQAVRLAQTAFVQNSIHFMNYRVEKNFKNFKKYLAGFKKWLLDNQIDAEYLCVDSSAIMAAYGLRDCNDLDIVHHGYDTQILNSGLDYLASHNTELQYHAYSKDEIIFNPNYFFYYAGVKFATLEVLKAMKTKRNEDPKDLTDLRLIENVNKLS